VFVYTNSPTCSSKLDFTNTATFILNNWCYKLNVLDNGRDICEVTTSVLFLLQHVGERHNQLDMSL